MADTKALEELNREIVKLVDELSAMHVKQERLKELMRQRAELEQQLLGPTADAGVRPVTRRRTNGVERTDEPAAAATTG
jgi:hypothetical protein